MNVIVVETPQGLADLTQRVEQADAVAVDTEFHNERSYAARLMVVQLVVDGDVVLVDPLSVADLSPLTAALGRTTVVGHALGSDLRIFAERFGALPANAFDTQLAAAFLGYGISISLADLVHDLVGIRLRKAHTVSDWSRRPLAPAQIEYLVDDVVHLLPMRDTLLGRLRERGRDTWFEEEARALVDPQRYCTDPERLYLRIPGAQRMNRRELAILRENLPFGDEHILNYVTDFLQHAHAADERYTARDGINIARFAMKLAHEESSAATPQILRLAITQTLGEEALRYVPRI